LEHNLGEKNSKMITMRYDFQSSW